MPNRVATHEGQRRPGRFPNVPDGCPWCGCDDYSTELGDDGEPDPEDGIKKCRECGGEWV